MEKVSEFFLADYHQKIKSIICSYNACTRIPRIY